MAIFANMSLTNAAAVACSFVAKINLGMSQVWRFAKDTNVVNDRTISTLLKPASRADGVHKVTLTFEVPLVDAPASGSGYTPAPKVVETTKCQMIWFLPARAATLDRQDAYAFVKAALNNTQISDLVVDFSPPRG